MIDESTEFGARVARHLREETVVWPTTVTPSGAPLPRPVGFLWDGGENISVHSQPGARIRNIGRNPKVALNFRMRCGRRRHRRAVGHGRGGPVRSERRRGRGVGGQVRAEWERVGMTAEFFAQRFSVSARIRISAVHGF